MPSQPTRLLVQLSDPHIVEAGARCMGVIPTADFLAVAVRAINELDPQPDLVLCTGDLVNEGRVAQYEHFRDLLAPLRAPYRLVVGNHDDRTALRQVFGDHRYLGDDGPCDYVCDDLHPLRLIVLDSLVPDQGGGSLSAEQLAWLDEQLAGDPERPTLVAVHHPPFATGIGYMDAIGLAPAAAAGLAEVLSGHRQVERLLCGHLHRTISRRFAGTIAMTAPSCAHAVALDLRQPGQGAWTDEPPAVAVHRWSPADAVVSHHLPLGHYPARVFGS